MTKHACWSFFGVDTVTSLTGSVFKSLACARCRGFFVPVGKGVTKHREYVGFGVSTATSLTGSGFKSLACAGCGGFLVPVGKGVTEYWDCTGFGVVAFFAMSFFKSLVGAGW